MSKDVEIIVSPRPEITGKITLYKYISVNGLNGLIEDGTFKVTYRKNCNDPQELTPAGEVAEISMYDHYGFLSFSKDGNNSPLWGNYADHYKGACIEFEFDCFDPEKIEKANEAERGLLLYARRIQDMGFNVKYFNAFYDGDKYIPSGLSRLLIDCLYSKDRSRIEWPQGSETMHEARKRAEEFAWAIMCTKDIGWEYEQEVRMPIYRNRDIINPVDEIRENSLMLTRVPTKYIKKIILGPLCEFTAGELQEKIDEKRQFIDNVDAYMPHDAVVVKAQFSKSSYALNYTGAEESEFGFY